MGNLGRYQTMTTLAKKVGGPEKLFGLVFAAGVASYRPMEASLKAAVRRVKARSEPCPTKNQVFQVASDGNAGGGLTLRAGGEFRVLECDRDAVLIEVIGDDNNPYAASGEFLSSVSNYPG